MLDDVRQNPDLAGAAKKLLLLADVRGELPTPVGRLIEAAGLHEPEESLLSDHCIEQAPRHLLAIMQSVAGKVLALLDRREKEVHISPTVASKAAFKRLHEVGHHIVPWQSALAYADNSLTLSPDTEMLFELEASHVAAELLFQQTLLQDQARSRRVRAQTVHQLADAFGATIHSTFRRYVETHDKAVAGVVLPRHPLCIAPLCFQRRETFCSGRWRAQFHDTRQWPANIETGPFAAVAARAAAVAALLDADCYEDPIREIVPWPDLNGEVRAMRIEVFTNTYHIFVLFTPSRTPLLRLPS